MAPLIPFNGKSPQVHPDAWLAPSATLIGDVHILAGASVWFGAVLRGDMDRIELGEGSNLQDNVVVHTDFGIPTIVGRNVGVGHLAIIHGATVGDGALIGMGAKLLNQAQIGAGAFVAASSLVREGQRVPPGHLVMGVPAKDRGEMSPAQRERVRRNAFQYQELSSRYRLEGIGAVGGEDAD